MNTKNKTFISNCVDVEHKNDHSTTTTKKKNSIENVKIKKIILFKKRKTVSTHHI